MPEKIPINCVKSSKGQVGHTQYKPCTRVMGLNPSVESFVPPSGNSNKMTLPVTGTCYANTVIYPSTQPACQTSGNSKKTSLPAPGTNYASTVKNLSTQPSYHTDEIALSNRFQVLQDLLVENEVDNAFNSHSPSTRERNGERNGSTMVETSTEVSLPTCSEYWQCKEQNGVEIGCVPLSPITLFTGDPM